MEIITVIEESEAGWRTLTSPEMPGLYMLVPEHDVEAAYEDLPRAIEELIFADSGARVSVSAQQTYCHGTAPPSHPPTRHFSIERMAA